MKTLLAILLLVPSLSWGKEYIYNCVVKKEYNDEQFIISFDDESEPIALTSINYDTGEFDDNSKLHFGGRLGKVTVLSNENKEFDLVVQDFYKGDGDSFRAFFTESSSGRSFLTSITIHDWDKEKPIIIYEDYWNKIYEGNCK